MILKIDGKKSGFTLTEAMVVIAILAIMSAIAYPSYRDQSRKTRRGEALTNILGIQANYEGYNAQYNSYPASNTFPPANSINNTENYAYTTITTPTTYTITATALPTSDQINDTQGNTSCASISIDNTGNQTPANCWKN